MNETGEMRWQEGGSLCILLKENQIMNKTANLFVVSKYIIDMLGPCNLFVHVSNIHNQNKLSFSHMWGM